MLRLVVEQNLTVKQIRQIIEKGTDIRINSDLDEMNRIPKSAMQIAKLALKPDEGVDSYRMAEAFLGPERDKTVVKARMKALREMLGLKKRKS